jgi:DNA-binding protein HU-beta
MNKSQLIQAIAESAGLTRSQAARALDGTTEAIRKALRKGEMVTLVGFGVFYVGKRAARAGRDPRTGAAIQIQATRLPKFRAGKSLRDAVN